jgi:hypothetical protein
MNLLKSVIFWFIGIIFLVGAFPVIFIAWLVTLPFDRERSVVHWILIYLQLLFTQCSDLKIKIEGRKKAFLVPIRLSPTISHYSTSFFWNSLRYRFK